MAHRIPFQRTFEMMSVTAFLATMAVLAERLFRQFDEFTLSSGPWLIAASIGIAIAGYVMADFLSGLVHFLGDTFGSREMPIIGRAFIQPFRDHHVNPSGITEHDFLEVNANNSFISLPFVGIAHLVAAQNPFIALFIFFVLLGVFATNQFHKWAHQANPNRVVRWLQARWLILSPIHHGKHHTPPFQSDYCITVGWLNPLLGALGFFPRLKTVLANVLPVAETE